MTVNLKHRNLLTFLDYSPEEIRSLLDLSLALKAEKLKGIFKKRLQNRNIALIFEKPSTRTRCAFVVAASDEGAHPEYLGKGDIQLGKKETVADTARVLGRLFDGIQFRGFAHRTVEILGQYAGVPVWNGLTDQFHPTQALADLMTMKEAFGSLEGRCLAFIGDGRNNVANSLFVICAKLGLEFRIVAPKALQPGDDLHRQLAPVMAQTGARILVTDDARKGVAGADALYTDVWASMGEEHMIKERIALLKPYQVTAAMMANTGKPTSIFLHCLPSFHNLETDVSAQNPDICEVTDEVFESKQSLVFQQAENRMHTIKAIMVATLRGPEAD